MTETLANGYSSESTPRELSNEYQHDGFEMIFIIFCFFCIGGILCGVEQGSTFPEAQGHMLLGFVLDPSIFEIRDQK